MLRDRLNEALKEAMRAKDPIAVSTLRLTLAALKDRDIAARSKGQTDGVGDQEVLDMLQKMVRQRRDSIEAYEEGNRPDLAEREAKEIEVIERFLPRQLDDAETKEAVDEVMSAVEAQGLKDMGKVMAELKTRYGGRMDFGKASAIVKSRLA